MPYTSRLISELIIPDSNTPSLHRAVAERMKQGQSIDAELFDTVTVYFSDVVSFTNLCSQSTPMEVRLLCVSTSTVV